MDVLEAVASRYSCRAFLPTPVPEKIVRDIIDRAARAPSAGNMQPWRIYAIAGKRVEELKALLAPRMATELPKGEGTDYTIYPEPLTEPYRARRFAVGELLYQSINVSRDDKPARYRQYARNFLFYDAPVGLFFSIDRTMGPPQWADLGGFIQTVMLLARSYGLHCCAQQAWTHCIRHFRAFSGFPATTCSSAAWPWVLPMKRHRSIPGDLRASNSMPMRHLRALRANRNRPKTVTFSQRSPARR